MYFILAQVCALITLILMITSVQFKDKEKIVFFNIIANVFVTIEYIFLNALTGMVISFLNTIRCLVFYLYKKKGLKPSLSVLITFEIITVVSGILSWQNYWSLIPIIATAIYTYGLWQDNVFVIKLVSCYVGLSWSVYNFVVKAYVGVIQEFLQAFSSFIALINMKIKNKKNKTISENSI